MNTRPSPAVPALATPPDQTKHGDGRPAAGRERSLTRILLAGIGLLGVAETTYLSVLLQRGQTIACPVVDSLDCALAFALPRGRFLGVPLPYLGYAFYALISLLALFPLLGAAGRPFRERWLHRSAGALLALSTAGALFSLDLVRVLLEMRIFCIWCFLSATLTLLLLATSALGFPWTAGGRAGPLRTGAALGLIGLLAGYVLAPRQEAPVPPSTPEALALAHHLRDSGAVLYGRKSCPLCRDQLALFGREASEVLPFFDCEDRPPQDGVQFLPTWVIGSSRLVGVQPLAQLAAASGFAGAQPQPGGTAAASSGAFD